MELVERCRVKQHARIVRAPEVRAHDRNLLDKRDAGPGDGLFGSRTDARASFLRLRQRQPQDPERQRKAPSLATARRRW
ncbi:MAG: hypothetical protein HPM95_05260 [Alphaproteobacteria bacterium]|nr:hypothetical protein [Alphaproteobacteria bacterium]